MASVFLCDAQSGLLLLEPLCSCGRSTSLLSHKQNIGFEYAAGDYIWISFYELTWTVFCFCCLVFYIFPKGVILCPETKTIRSCPWPAGILLTLVEQLLPPLIPTTFFCANGMSFQRSLSFLNGCQGLLWSSEGETSTKIPCNIWSGWCWSQPVHEEEM